MEPALVSFHLPFNNSLAKLKKIGEIVKINPGKLKEP